MYKTPSLVLVHIVQGVFTFPPRGLCNMGLVRNGRASETKHTVQGITHPCPAFGIGRQENLMLHIFPEKSALNMT
jgi:hypothetical protein